MDTKSSAQFDNHINNENQRELRGKLSKFLVDRKFGFITVPGLDSDIFVSAEDFERAHITPRPELALIVESYNSAKGARVKHIRLAENLIEVESDRVMTATIKWFSEGKGYGFVSTRVGDAFIHHLVCKAAHVPTAWLKADFKLAVVVGPGREAGTSQVNVVV